MLLFIPESFKLPLSIRVTLFHQVEKDHITEESSLLNLVLFSDVTGKIQKVAVLFNKCLMVLTAPIKASPEATLTAVGMMLNFPAYE